MAIDKRYKANSNLSCRKNDLAADGKTVLETIFQYTHAKFISNDTLKYDANTLNSSGTKLDAVHFLRVK